MTNNNDLTRELLEQLREVWECQAYCHESARLKRAAAWRTGPPPADDGTPKLDALERDLLRRLAAACPPAATSVQ